MRKNLLLLITIALLGVASAFAQGGITGPLTWELNNGTLAISGEGEMPNYGYATSPWVAYLESITAVVIGENVTSIGNYAFWNCVALSSIIIPNSVATIGNDAFIDCITLISVTLGNSVATIGASAFARCSALTSITIPNSVTTIGNNVFFGCVVLTSIEVENENENYTSVDGVLFNKGKTTLIRYPAGKTNANYTIPNSITTIGDGAFESCSFLASIIIPDGVITIGGSAFSSCTNLSTINIPENVTSIGSSAFYNCEALTSITIPNGVTTIEWYTFSSCRALTSITLGNSVASIGWYAFRSCSALISITIPNNVTTIGNEAFTDCSELTSITIPNGVISIGNYAFSFCIALTSITIPNSVTSIGIGAFARCSTLTSIEVENGNENYTSIDGVLFNKGKTTLIQYPAGKTNANYTILNSITTVAGSAFSGCTTLTSITILNTVPIELGSNVFIGVNISTVILQVPTSAVLAYQNTAIWQEFDIVGSGILVNLTPNNIEYGYTTGSALYQINETAIVTATARSGYRLVNWTKDGVEVSTDNPYSFTVTEDVELVANFEEDRYLVNVSANNDEYGTTTGGGYYDSNATVIVTATANNGYRFVNWTKNDIEVSTDNPYNFTVTEDVELVANFEDEVGIEKFEHINLKIYPNPTTGELKIESEKMRIDNMEIFDVFGKKVLFQKSLITPEIVINISHLPAGVYFVKISTEVGQVTKKVLKE